MSFSKEQPTNSTANNKNSLEQPPHFMKMNVDCWERVFDLLSLRDIFALSETCKRMRQMAGYYFREYFPGIRCRWISNRGIYIGYPTSILRADFSEYITKLMVYDYLEHFLYAEHYYSLKSLHLRSMELTDTQIDYLKNVLNNIENIEIKQCTIYGDLHEKFLQHCPKLKRLRLHDVLYEPEDAEKYFFNQKYSSLQYLDYSTMQIYPSNNELNHFLEQNTDLKHFGVSNLFVWTNRDLFLKSNIKLDTFAIYTAISMTSDDDVAEVPTVEFVNLLKTLYEREFFKSLHFKIIETDGTINYQELIDELATLDALEVLVTNENNDLSRLTNLKELWFLGYHYATTMELLAINLTKIERLYFQQANTDDIQPFFQHSKRLKTIKVDEVSGGKLLEDGIALNLYALNLERERLRVTRRVTICVKENIYLATKNRKKNLNLARVEVARWDSEEWNIFDQRYAF